MLCCGLDYIIRRRQTSAGERERPNEATAARRWAPGTREALLAATISDQIAGSDGALRPTTRTYNRFVLSIQRTDNRVLQIAPFNADVN